MNQKVNRNAPCPCGSGEKYKKCCAKKEMAQQQKRLSGLKGLSAKALSFNPMTTLAKKVFKVLSDTETPAADSLNKHKASSHHESSPHHESSCGCGCTSLEELIGLDDKNVKPTSSS